jgi:hypothetical protein
MEINCNRIGRDGLYVVSFTVDTVNHPNIFLGNIKIPDFFTPFCKFYVEGYNKNYKKYNCSVRNSISPQDLAYQYNKPLIYLPTEE